MFRLQFASSLALSCLAVLVAQSARAEPRAVIELFTSQGCSSCPAADKLIAEYSRDPSIIALSLAVDYWDYLGWKDTLALHGHSNRQRAYARARGDREVYTPQVVVDGAVHALGSDKAAIEKAMRQTREQSSPLLLPVTIERAGDARSPSPFPLRSAVAKTADRPSLTPTWCGAGSSSEIGPARPRRSVCRSRTFFRPTSTRPPWWCRPAWRARPS
jgi:hypothetical protein